jgi:MFS family permease
MRWYDLVTINAYWFALTTRAQVLTPLIIPLLVQEFVGDAAKGRYVGIMRLWALMAAVLLQALMGMFSDRSTLRWGRRRPFIVAGTVGEWVVFILIGLTASLDGMTGYWVLFGLYLLSMVSSNTAHAATQALIPDLVPEDKRGLFSGVKVLLELPLPLIFVSFVVGRMVSAGSIWGALFAVMIIMLVCMLITLLVREKPLTAPLSEPKWGSFLRLVLMTAVFTVIILGAGAAVKTAMHAFSALPAQLSRALVAVCATLGMGGAAFAGVWVSIRIGVGPDIRRQPSFTWWVINRLAFLVAATNLAGFLLFFYQERFADLSQEKAAGPAANAIMLVGVFVLLTALPGGWLADRIGKKPLIALAGLLAAMGAFLVVILASLEATYVGACMVGAATGLFYSANWALGTELVPREQAGRYLGVSNLAGAGAGAIGAYIGGPIADSFGYVFLFAIYGSLFLLSVLALKGIRLSGTS